MSASGLVYAAIVLMWAAVLIPMWVRRHDAGTENRSAERFGKAMRVLSRSEAPIARREIVLPAAPPTSGPGAAAPQVTSRQRVASPAAASPSTARPDRRRVQAPRPASAAARSALARRRARTLAVLGGLAVLLGGLALLQVIPAWPSALAGVLLVGFVVHLRLEARRGQQRRVRPRPGVRRPEAAEPERADTSRALVVETKGESATATVSSGVAVAAEDVVASEPPAVAGSDDWRPSPLPLPTYVTAPKAVRPIRVIDLTTPGAWTSGRLLDDDVPVVADALAAAEAEAEELDALLEHDVALDAEALSKPDRRAVGD